MLNLVVLMGNLGANPEIRTTPNGVKVARMRLAVNDIWTNRSSGQKEQRTHWVDLNAWDRLAVTAERFLTKGSKIAIRGSLEYREWTSQEGMKRSKLEVRVRELIMLSTRSEQSGYGNQRPDKDPYENNHDSFSKQSESSRTHNQSDYNNPQDDPDYNSPVDDDDIPF